MRSALDTELATLRTDNARLLDLLDAHRIAWRVVEAVAAPVAATQPTTDEKVELFCPLWRPF